MQMLRFVKGMMLSAYTFRSVDYLIVELYLTNTTTDTTTDTVGGTTSLHEYEMISHNYESLLGCNHNTP